MHLREAYSANILVASLSFQFPDIDGFGTGFLIFNLIFCFSDLMAFLTAPPSNNPVPDAEPAAGVAVVH
jgi:hypothetical protein